MRLLGLPAALARFGLTVEVVPGWETRGSSSFAPGCTIGHHTAGSSRGTRPSLSICTNGRADLPGPLCNTFTDRNGVAVVVASGRANHAGPGGFRGLVGNSAAIGHEAEDEGDGRWTEAQRWAFPRVHAAHLWLLGRDASWYVSHRNWAIPRGRKPDPAGLADDDMQHQIHALLTGSPPGPRVLRLTDPYLQGNDVRAVQRWAQVADDGVYGPATAAAVTAKQSAAGLVADGVVGPTTWAVVLGPPVTPVPVPPPVPQRKKADMTMFWHKGAVYALVGGKRWLHGLPPQVIDAYKAAGVTVLPETFLSAQLMDPVNYPTFGA